jgi:hypothetical protein
MTKPPKPPIVSKTPPSSVGSGVFVSRVHANRYPTGRGVFSAINTVTNSMRVPGIGLSLFFVIPSNGQNILFFGTSADPSDDLWNEVTGIVSGIVQQSIGLERPRCRSLRCATTDTAPIT